MFDSVILNRNEYLACRHLGVMFIYTVFGTKIAIPGTDRLICRLRALLINQFPSAGYGNLYQTITMISFAVSLASVLA